MIRGIYALGVVVTVAGLIAEGVSLGSLLVLALMYVATAAGAARWGAALGMRAMVAEDDEGDD